MKIQNKQRGFTLVEMLVVITIIAILAAMALPALSAARESARNSTCKSNLRNFYIGLTTFADKDPSQRFTSGAWDGRRDGCLDSIGWVADMVNTGICKPQELLCPSASTRGSEKLNDYLGVNTFAASEGGSTALVSETGICRGTTFPVSGTWIADNLLAKGYGTNYMSSWFLSRSAPKLKTTYTSNEAVSIFPKTSKIKGLSGTLGPLTRRMVDNSYYSSSLIPMLGDANVGDVKEGVLAEELKATDGTLYLPAGERLCESFNDGPHQKDVGSSAVKLAIWGDGTNDITVLDTAANTNLYLKEQPPAGTNAAYDHLQDYRDLGPNHGSGRGGSCNVLMADGSAKQFVDQNGDGFLNPGFVVPATMSAAQKAGIGYVDSLVELPAAQIVTGVFLSKWSTKDNLDQ